MESQIKKLPACRSDFHITVLETVERLETQMRDMTLVMNECETKKLEIENELKEAIDKIWVLRDIIRDLESQIEEKSKTEVDLKNIVTQLEDKINYETKRNEELIEKVETLNSSPGSQYQEIIRKLEVENQKLKVSSELVGPDGVLKQVKTQLNEIEKTLEKRTKDLESLHAVNTNCSSPSEDMSIRDQIRPPSNNANSANNDDSTDLPLEQLARLKDKLIRHARAEDAAMKRIRDLEMQLFTSKHDYEEMQSERDVLQDQLSEQLVLISSLQLRLDEQRLRVESAQKQSNTSFDRKIYELENEIQSLKEMIHIRDNNNKQLSVVVEQTKKRIAEQEKQLNNAVDIEKQIVDQFEAEIGRLKSENDDLKRKLQNEVDHSTTQIYVNEALRSKSQSPETFAADTLDTLLAEKNADIDRLKSKLNDYKEELKFYSSLNFSKDQLLQLSSIEKLSPPPYGGADDDNANEPELHRRQQQAEHTFDSITSANNHLEFKRNANETVFIGSTFRDSKYADKMHHSPFVASELSAIEKDGAATSPPRGHKHVHFDEHHAPSELSTTATDVESKLVQLQQEVARQNNTIKTYEIDIDMLRRKLQFSDDTIRDKTDELNEQIDTLNEAIKDARIEVAQLKLQLEQKEATLEHLEKDAQRKDKMFTNLVQEKRDLESKYKDLEARYAEFANYEQMMEQKNKEIFELEQQLAQIATPLSLTSTESLHESILQKEKQIEHLSTAVAKLKQECEHLNKKLGETEKHLENKNHLLGKKDKDYENILSQFNELTSHIEELKVTLDEKCKKMAEMERDVEREKELRDSIAKYQKEIAQLRETIEENERKLKEQSVADIKNINFEVEQKVLANQLELEKKELEILNQKALIDNLNKEIHHLQDYLNEKDKIIQQMTSDSNSLHSALEAIQSKIQESGNVVDLKKRLREEQNLTTALHEQLKYLKQSIEQFENAESVDAMETLVLLKDSIDKEKINNLELKTSNHSLTLEVKALKEKFSAAEKTIEKLTQLLADEKVNSNTIQVQDANIIESMRVRLEALLDHENDTERQLRKEQEKRKELEEQLYGHHCAVEPMDAELKLTSLKLNVAQVAAENDILKSELDTVKTLNQMLNTELQQSKELIENQQTELKSLKYAVECLSQMKYDTKKQHNVDLFSKIEDENLYLKQKVNEMSKSVTSLREKEKELCQLLAVETNRQLDSVVPDKFLRKIRDINMLLQSHIADNKQLTNSLAVLTEENKLLQARLKEVEKSPQLKSPFDDPVARADHLFGRYLKSESYRKALIFQKRYLLTLLASYQRGSSLSTAVLHVILPKNSNSRGIHRFRVVVYAVMSIRRMQYIVQRWHTGKRIGASIVTKRPYVMNRPFTAQPSLNYVVKSSNGNRGNSSSPPSRDRSYHIKSEHLGDTIQESIALAPLQAPAMLSNYIERFDSIQQKLGLAIQKSST